MVYILTSSSSLSMSSAKFNVRINRYNHDIEFTLRLDQNKLLRYTVLILQHKNSAYYR